MHSPPWPVSAGLPGATSAGGAPADTCGSTPAHGCPAAGAGSDGVEEIKRHPFFVSIDWNVSGRGPPHSDGGHTSCRHTLRPRPPVTDRAGASQGLAGEEAPSVASALRA